MRSRHASRHPNGSKIGSPVDIVSGGRNAGNWINLAEIFGICGGPTHHISEGEICKLRQRFALAPFQPPVHCMDPGARGCRTHSSATVLDSISKLWFLGPFADIVGATAARPGA